MSNSTNTDGQWSAHPFVLLDGGDSAGVKSEIQVKKGVGSVESVENHANGRTSKVSIRVGNLKHPLVGWLNTDEPAYDALVEANARGELAEFRIESQRKKEIARDVPIAEVANLDRRSIIAGARLASSSDGIKITKEALTNPADDPRVEGAPRSAIESAQAERSQAPAPQPTAVTSVPVTVNVSALVNAIRSGLPEGVINALAAQALASGASQSDVMQALYADSRTSNHERNTHAQSRFAREEAPWKTFNSDGRLNMGSSMVTASVSAEQYARSLVITSIGEDADAYDEEGIDRIVFALARHILEMSDHAQESAYGEGFNADRSASSHARARGIVYDTIEHCAGCAYPGVETEDLYPWVTKVSDKAATRLSMAAALALESFPSSNPPQRQQEPAAPVALPDYVFSTEAPDDGKEPRGTQETISILRDAVSELTDEEKRGLGRLMTITLGHGKVVDASDRLVQEFLDFYTERDGIDDIRKAIEWSRGVAV